MSAALRVLGLTLAGWIGVRAMTLGIVPGADLFLIGRSEAQPAPIRTTAFPPLDPPGGYADVSWPLAQSEPLPAAYPYPMAQRVALPVYYPAPAYPAYASTTPIAGLANLASGPAFQSAPQFAAWPASPFSPLPAAGGQSTVAVPGQSNPAFLQPKTDRIQLTAWSLLRGRQGVTVSPQSLAPGGTLGGSQAGARLTYVITPQLAASLRATSPVGGSGGEVAAGIKVTPIASVPIALTAERRQAIGRFGGRNAFALFLEGGLYQQRLWGLDLDGYAQAGVVGVRERAYFADGGFTLSRPLYPNFSGGLGVWGGVQPGLYRIDAGPRLTMRVRGNMRVHLDWRQRVAGNALPRSGPALTLAGDF